MTKTTNYQLNQWAASDPIRRADFNADNAAIDAAIKAVEQNAANALASYQSTANAAIASAQQDASNALAAYKETTDAALAEIRPEKVLLKEYTSTAAGSTHRISLNDIDLSRYRKLIIEPTMLYSDLSQYKFYLNNKVTSESVLVYQSSLVHSDVLARLYTCPALNTTAVNHFCWVELDLTTTTVRCDYLQFVAYTTTYNASWSLASARGTSLHKTLTPAEITEVTLSYEGTLYAGSTVKVYGVK